MSHYQRVPTSHCARCQKQLAPGSRVTMAFIVQQVGHNPRNPRELGAMLGEEFELVHVDCERPLLRTDLVIGG